MGTKVFLQNSSGQILKNGSGQFLYNALPSVYQEVEYIASNGTPYLSTVVAANKLFEMDIQFTSNSSRQLMGISGSSSAYFGNNSGTWEKIGTTGTSYSTLDRVTLCYDVGNITASKTNTWIKGATNKFVGSDTNFATASANNLRIFNLAGSGYGCSMKLYSLKVYNASGIALNIFVPCYRKSDSVIGMYDLVENKFYTNAGSGTFTKGDNVA